MHVSTSLFGNPTTPRTLEAQEEYEKMKMISPYTKKVHMEHCDDRLREYVMLTSHLLRLIRFDRKTGPRVCRKWEPIWRWIDGRDETLGVSVCLFMCACYYKKLSEDTLSSITHQRVEQKGS